MKKFFRILGRTLAGILAVILCLLLALYVIPLTERVSDAGAVDSADWMAELRDDLILSQITLPGSHDSATQNVQLAFFSKCQGLDIGQQLEIGVRYLDIRLGADGDRLKLMHGFTNCKTSPLPWAQALYLEQVLEPCYAFLDAHPTETVVFAVKQEHGDESVAAFETLLQAYTARSPEHWLLTDHLPTLGEARGKLVLMRRYDDAAGLDAESGIPLLWDNQSGNDDVSLNTAMTDNGSYRLWVQDRYEYAAADKWTAFSAGMRLSTVSAEDAAIHFLSTKGTLAYGHPYHFAGRLNDQLLAWTLGRENGWIVVDFAEPALIEHIYSANF